jgi:hypothetical protein
MFWKVCKNIYKELSPVQEKLLKRVTRRRTSKKRKNSSFPGKTRLR